MQREAVLPRARAAASAAAASPALTVAAAAAAAVFQVAQGLDHPDRPWPMSESNHGRVRRVVGGGGRVTH